MQAKAWGQQREYDVLAIGEVNVDLIMSGLPGLPGFGEEVLAEDILQRLGGSTANFVVCCAKLGLRVAFVAKVGLDDFGDFLVNELERWRFGSQYITRDPELRTGVTVSLSGPEDRAFVTYVGTIDSLTGDDIPDALIRSCRHVHVGSYFLQSKLQPALPGIFRRARDEVDLFLPNEVEGPAIAGVADETEALRALGERCGLVAMKLGVEGAMAREGERCLRVPGVDVEVVDTTCCGDAFDAGFTCAMLRGRPLEECLTSGNAFGMRRQRNGDVSRQMRTPGGQSGRARDLALAYGGTSLVLLGLGIVLIRSGATRTWPRHVDFGLFVLACAVGAGVYALVNRNRKAAGHVVVLVVTNQRVMLYRPDTGLDETFEHELDEVVSARDFGPAESPSRQASVVVGLEFEDGADLTMKMTLATAHELAPARGTYLITRPRRVRVVILETHGPIPARTDQELATILDAGKPALRQLVLEEHYLRILDDGAPRIGELWWYFHWDHMQVGALEPAALEGVPEDWLKLRLVFHGRSFIVVCGRPAVIRRTRDKALAGGAGSISSGGA